MCKPRVVVIGSSNTDLVVRVDRLPSPGETVVGGDMTVVQGGKGANQAVAAARLGASVCFVARVGDDAAGSAARAAYHAEGIDIGHVLVTNDVPTGTALIPVEAGSGRNAIVVSPGANARLSPADVDEAAGVIRSADLLVISFEIPPETVEASILLAARNGVPVLCNPAPARILTDPVLRLVRWMTPNEEECALLGGPDHLHRFGMDVISTHGENGALHYRNDQVRTYAAPKVEVVDTVAAGDCFTAALSVGLAGGQELSDAIPYAVAAASLKVTRAGAQPGLPFRADVDRFLASLVR